MTSDGFFMCTQKTFVKVVSDLKARLDYCEDLTRSCENYKKKILPKLTKKPHTVSSQVFGSFRFL
jgi:hypothetical protein